MEFQVSLSLQSKRDLKQIGHYIAQTDVEAAHRFCDQLVLAAESLRNFPSRHGSFARGPNIRKVPFKSYLIFYRINDGANTVEILRFWHGAQNQHRLRLKEESSAYAQAARPVS